MFKPRNMDSRERQYLTQMGMDPIIELLNKDGGYINFLMDTAPDEYNWGIQYAYFYVGNKTVSNLSLDSNYYMGIKNLIIDYLEQEIAESVYSVEGQISINNGELCLTLSMEYEAYLSEEKSYKL
jgi:hypothetical protein